MTHLERNSVLLTGANSGIGLECAKALCAVGSKCDLTITVRDDQKGKDTVELLRSINPECLVTYYVMDLADHDSIRKFVNAFLASGKQLNVLINNAGLGLFTTGDRVTAPSDTNMELTMAVNCIGPFLLTSLLLDLLQRSAQTRGDGNPSRIVNVTSGITSLSVMAPKFHVDDIMSEHPGNYLSGAQAYSNSKIGMNLWTKEMASRVDDTVVTVNALCPGLLPNTNLTRSGAGFM